MRRLAFPTAASSQRESSCDLEPPLSSTGNENGIDPALKGETPIDPALLEDEGRNNHEPVSVPATTPISDCGASETGIINDRDATRNALMKGSRICILML